MIWRFGGAFYDVGFQRVSRKHDCTEARGIKRKMAAPNLHPQVLDLGRDQTQEVADPEPIQGPASP